MKLRLAVFSALFAAALSAQVICGTAGDVFKEGFEGQDLERDINPRFKICHRPENRFRLSSAKARFGKQSLELTIAPPQTMVARQMWDLNPKNCLLESQEASYESDKLERAEIWEDKDENPRFGMGEEPLFYGFSMWIDGKDARKDDFNRLVLGQWKAGCEGICNLSPFLGQRLTGGFYHITLDVDAYSETAGRQEGKTCKVLLAFTGEKPALFDGKLPLDRLPQCESRLQYPPLAENELKPVDQITIKRERYLPDPFGRWTDLVFKVDAGRKDGVIQVWADGKLIATASGWLGHHVSVGTKQYFKFGPYRDVAAYGVTVYLDNLARGASYNDVDPRKF